MKKEIKNRINEQIKESVVRIIEEDGSTVMQLKDALARSKREGLDLIEVSPGICKIMDFSKFLYQQKKRDKENRLRSKNEVKEIRLTPQTGEHDYQFKLKHAKEFLGKGEKVKFSVFFKGRSIIYKDQGEILLLKFANDLMDIATADKMPVLEGKKMIMSLTPKKK
jgi:translation initiation factor IF-3